MAWVQKKVQLVLTNRQLYSAKLVSNSLEFFRWCYSSETNLICCLLGRMFIQCEQERQYLCCAITYTKLSFIRVHQMLPHLLLLEKCSQAKNRAGYIRYQCSTTSRTLNRDFLRINPMLALRFKPTASHLLARALPTSQVAPISASDHFGSIVSQYSGARLYDS